MARKNDDNDLRGSISRLAETTNEIKSDVKEIKEHVHKLSITSNEHKIILDEHIRRTELNEKAISILDAKDDQILKQISERIVPLERHVNMWAGAGKVIAVLSLLVGIAGAVWKVVSLL